MEVVRGGGVVCVAVVVGVDLVAVVVVGVVVVVAVVAAWQLRPTRSVMFEAPSLRSLRSVVFRSPGRLEMSLLKALTAELAALHCLASRADLI
jgi:hypothetical protein